MRSSHAFSVISPIGVAIEARRVVHERVEPAERLHRILDEPDEVRGLQQIALHQRHRIRRVRRSSSLFERARFRRGRAVMHDEIRAGARADGARSPAPTRRAPPVINTTLPSSGALIQAEPRVHGRRSAQDIVYSSVLTHHRRRHAASSARSRTCPRPPPEAPALSAALDGAHPRGDRGGRRLARLRALHGARALRAGARLLQRGQHEARRRRRFRHRARALAALRALPRAAGRASSSARGFPTCSSSAPAAARSPRELLHALAALGRAARALPRSWK